LLKSRFGEDVQIKPGQTGQFDVIVDGRKIFSKAGTGRFPIDGEVEESYAKLRKPR
jgi:predicted Rdx family selenoprotein